MIRIGCGFDIHAFAENRRLVLAGVDVPHVRGLAGHSDADVLTHAVCDALLGACALGDIGAFYPDDDERYRNADSLALLGDVAVRVAACRATVVNVDVTVVMQSPKIASFVGAMRENLAKVLAVAVDRIGVKATTGEHLGFVGREEGVAVMAVALVEIAE